MLVFILSCLVIFTSGATKKYSGIGRSGSIAAQKCKAYTALACGKSHRRGILHHSSRPLLGVTGGNFARTKQFPHMAVMGSQRANPYWYCGASLISDSFVVTAAHCIYYSVPDYLRFGELDLTKKGGSPGSLSRKVTKYIVHPSYNVLTQFNDIALVRFEKLAKFTDHLRPICLHISEQIPNRKFIVAGFGKTSETDVSYSSQLRYAELDKQNHAQCQKYFKNYNDKSMVCAGHSPGGRDACQRDSGGPLQILNTPKGCSKPVYSLVGVVSKGKGCGRPNIPGVYTKISHFLSWIEGHVWK